MAPPRNTLSGAALIRAAKVAFPEKFSRIQKGMDPYETAPSRTCIAPLCAADPDGRSFDGDEPGTD
jgi:hypothetical protein